MLGNNSSIELSRVGGGLRARNIMFNIMGQVIPIVFGLIAIPFVIKGLGVEVFGILSIAWMLLGYFSIFDLGLGRATTKFISEELKNGVTENLKSLFWTSCCMNLFLGLIGGLIIFGISSFLAESVFKISLNLIHVARTVFIILAVSCPVILVSMAFRGALEAAQQFKYVNIVVASSSSLSFILPVIGILAGLNLSWIVFFLMISRLCGAIAFLLLCFRVFPILKKGISVNIFRIRQLINFGGWISISNIINPVLSYLDRFLIGSLISVTAVSYYTAPYEIGVRLSILPTSFAMTLFPSFSAASADSRKNMIGLYSRSVKILLVLIGPLVAILILFAKDILYVWLGAEFADKSTVVLQIIAAGMLLNSLAQMPFALIQGFGRPDMTAKFHVLELVLYLPLMWLLVMHMGIIGGAIAWFLRVTIDAVLLFTVSIKFLNSKTFFDSGLKRTIIMVSSLICILFGLSLFSGTILIKMIISGVMLAIFAIVSWRHVLDAAERELICSAVRKSVGIIEVIN